VRAPFVVMLDIDAEDALELVAVEDQDSVEALTPGAADPALRPWKMAWKARLKFASRS
jgi:hypothetical protein